MKKENKPNPVSSEVLIKIWEKHSKVWEEYWTGRRLFMSTLEYQDRLKRQNGKG